MANAMGHEVKIGGLTRAERDELFAPATAALNAHRQATRRRCNPITKAIIATANAMLRIAGTR